MRFIYIFCLFLAIVSNSVLSVMLLRRKARSPMIVSFILVLFFIIFWALCSLGIALWSKSIMYETLDTIAAFGYIPLPIAFLTFSLCYAGFLNIICSFKYWFSLVIPASVFLYISSSSDLISVHSASRMNSGYWGDYSPTGPFFLYFLIWFETLMFISLSILVWHYLKTRDPIKKRQAFWVMLATGIPLLIGSVTDGILPTLGYTMFPAAIPLTSITTFSTYYAIHKYGLFEISMGSILSSITEGMVTVDLSGNIISINRAAQTLLRIPLSKALGKPFAKVMNLKDENNKTITPKFSPVILPIHSGKTIKDDRYSLIIGRKSMPVSLTASPIQIQTKVIGATIMFHDISRQKEVDKAKNEFVSFASHQLANPLSVVKTYTEYILSKNSDNLTLTQQKYLNEIRKSSLKMSGIISDFLNISKIERHVIDIQPMKTNIIETTEAVLRELETQIEEKKLTVMCNYRGDMNEIKIDRQIVNITLQNLLSNEVKYTSPGGKITVTIIKKKNQLSFKVADTGVGIPADEQAHIGSKLYRAHNAKNFGIHGTGLGLYLVKTLMQKAGGTFKFTSAENKGSTFVVMIPIGYTKRNS